MSDSLVFSIITPTLNCASTIEGCLKSVAGQTFRDVEHIIVDGLSDDGTQELAGKYDDGSGKVIIVSEKDRGIYEAMNKGINLANGRWLFFLGSDDELFDQHVLSNLFSKVLSSTKARLVYGDVLICRDIQWAKRGDIYDGKFDVDKLFSRNICHQAIFYRRDLFAEYGLFNLSYPVCSDWEMNLRLFKREKTIYVPQIIARFGGGISGGKNVSDPMLTELNEIRKKYYPIRYYLMKVRNSITYSFFRR